MGVGPKLVRKRRINDIVSSLSKDKEIVQRTIARKMLEGFQRMSKVYDSLMKSGAFTAAQNKEQSSEGIDSVGELVRMCEEKGFIPRYYTDGPQDNIDKILLDMQRYTRTLVTEEMGLGNMIESSLKQIQMDREKEMQANAEDEEERELEKEIFKYDEDDELTDKDYEDYFERQNNLKESDT